jgi:putative transposase
MIYRYFQISKQAVHQYESRLFNRLTDGEHLLEEVKLQRRDHPRMGAKVLYSVLKPKQMGRIRFENLLRENGFNLSRVKNYFRTTDSSWVRYKNLIAGRSLNDINQVWVSDITYYMLKDRMCYITTLMDLYSRRIIGFVVSLTMSSEESSMKCLRMALKGSGNVKHCNLIHHSDRGSQYRYRHYINLLQRSGIQISMCRSVYDNSHMERLNGTVKNDYLIPLGVDDFFELKRKLPIIVKRYNSKRPHSSLQTKTPEEFENYIKQLHPQKRPTVNIKPEIFTIPQLLTKEKRSKKEKSTP